MSYNCCNAIFPLTFMISNIILQQMKVFEKRDFRLFTSVVRMFYPFPHIPVKGSQYTVFDVDSWNRVIYRINMKDVIFRLIVIDVVNYVKLIDKVPKFCVL